jgi:hypothetical protein
MSNVSQGDGWWEASDGKWYAPESHPEYVQPLSPGQIPSDLGEGPATGPSAPSAPTQPVAPSSDVLLPPAQQNPSQGWKQPKVWIGVGVLVLAMAVVGALALAPSSKGGSSSSSKSTSSSSAPATVSPTQDFLNKMSKHLTDFNLVPSSDWMQAGKAACTQLENGNGVWAAAGDGVIQSLAMNDVAGAIPNSTYRVETDAYFTVGAAVSTMCQQESATVRSYLSSVDSTTFGPGETEIPALTSALGNSQGGTVSTTTTAPPPPTTTTAPPPPVPAADQAFVTDVSTNPYFNEAPWPVWLQAGNTVCTDLGQNDGAGQPQASVDAGQAALSAGGSILQGGGVTYVQEATVSLINDVATTLCPQYASVVSAWNAGGDSTG